MNLESLTMFDRRGARAKAQGSPPCLLNLLLEGSRNYNDRKQKEKPLTQIPLQNHYS